MSLTIFLLLHSLKLKTLSKLIMIQNPCLRHLDMNVQMWACSNGEWNMRDLRQWDWSGRTVLGCDYFFTRWWDVNMTWQVQMAAVASFFYRANSVFVQNLHFLGSTCITWCSCECVNNIEAPSCGHLLIGMYLTHFFFKALMSKSVA